MSSLPLELWVRVCSLSDIRLLKKLRVLNSTFAQLAAQYLFEGLCLSFIPIYLDKITEVAFHPTLRFHVRTIYFDHYILDEKFAEYETWEATIDTREPVAGKVLAPKNLEAARWQCSQADLYSAHNNLGRLLTSQKDLFDSRMDLVVLSAALAMLQNMRTIKGIEAVWLGGALPTPHHSITGHEKNWVPILSNLQAETLLQEPCIHLTRPGTARPLASLVSALGLTRRQIRTMELLLVPWEFWRREGLLGFEQGVRPHIRAAFRHLESLIVQTLVDEYDLGVSLQGLMPPSIRTFIGAAPGLRLLNLGFRCYSFREIYGDGNWLPRKFPRAGQAFDTLELPRLAILHVHCCIFTEDTLIGFIRHHATRLKEIFMNNIVLDNQSVATSSWEKILKQISPSLFLDHVDLRGLLSDDIQRVIDAEDRDFEACDFRHEAYCRDLSGFLLQRGRVECPRILDYARKIEEFPPNASWCKMEELDILAIHRRSVMRLDSQERIEIETGYISHSTYLSRASWISEKEEVCTALLWYLG